MKDGDVPETKESTLPKSQSRCPTARRQYLDKMSIHLSRRCWEKGGYLDSYLNTVPGPISRHPSAYQPEASRTSNKFETAIPNPLALGRKKYFLSHLPNSLRKRLDFVAKDAAYPGKFQLAIGI